VKNHIKNVLFKLTLENRVQLAAYAFKHGLTEKT
jgi:two-component system nitrate/nitrite response regulator NarL